MSLQDPSKKMSTSDPSELSKILLSDDADTIRKKIMRAVTDTDGGVSYDPDRKPAIASLMTIFHHATGKTMKDIEAEFEGKGYGDFKKALAEALIEHLGPVTKKYHEYRDNPNALGKLLDAGRESAQALAAEKMKLVRQRVGLGR